MQAFKCRICGYVYRPEKGFPVDGIPPETAFEEVPEDWRCPVCGARKIDFIPLD